LATVLAIALLFVGVLGVYRMGVREGYAQGWWQAETREEAAPAPDGAPYPWGPRARWDGPVYGHRTLRGGHLGRLLALGLGLLLLLALVKAVLFKAWHAHGAHGKAGGWRKPAHVPWGHGPWSHGPRGRSHGPCGPWGWDESAEGDGGEDEGGDGEPPAEAPKDEQFGKVPSEPDAA
jgi:hypothetical protein